MMTVWHKLNTHYWHEQLIFQQLSQSLHVELEQLIVKITVQWSPAF